MSSFRLKVAYDGTDFFGSQIQPGRRTVQGEVLRVFGQLAGGENRVTFAGRSDRGVHAQGQVAAAFLPNWTRGAAELERALASRLPGDIAASDVEVCPAAFHPRFDAAWREYRYWLLTGTRDPRWERFAWSLRSPVDIEKMASAAVFVAGRHDFATFASGGDGVPWSARAEQPRGTTRTVYRIDVREREQCSGMPRFVEIRITADGFLPRMARNIIGGLVEIGQGRRAVKWIDELLATRDRRAGPVAAPAHGLTLWRVGYANERIEDS